MYWLPVCDLNRFAYLLAYGLVSYLALLSDARGAAHPKSENPSCPLRINASV